MDETVSEKGKTDNVPVQGTQTIVELPQSLPTLKEENNHTHTSLEQASPNNHSSEQNSEQILKEEVQFSFWIYSFTYSVAFIHVSLYGWQTTLHVKYIEISL